MTRVLVILFLCWSGGAEDARLAEVKATLVAMRGRATEHRQTRGATPTLTIAKHQLRDWIESRLSELLPDGEPAVLAAQLNQELKRNGIFCSSRADCEEPGESFDALGFLDDLHLRFDGPFLVVQTSAGIQCGFDDSAYLYEWRGSKWNRVWESEQNDYRKDKYEPQNIQAVVISGPHFDPKTHDSRHDNLIMTLGVHPWCTSNWRPIYYRVWRISPEPKLLIARAEQAYLASDTLAGGATADQVLIEFTVHSIDGGVLTRTAVQHLAFGDKGVQRVDPIALSPRDFVDEWLTQPWSEAEAWSGGALQNWHKELHSDLVFGEFSEPTLHCMTPDLWQVGASVNDTDTYFLVRWRPPYRFSMVDIRKTPWPNCVEKDPAADERRTLFPNRR